MCCKPLNLFIISSLVEPLQFQAMTSPVAAQTAIYLVLSSSHFLLDKIFENHLVNHVISPAPHTNNSPAQHALINRRCCLLKILVARETKHLGMLRS